MDWYDLKILLKATLTMLVVIIVFGYIITTLQVYTDNQLMEENCRLLAENGSITKVETLQVLLWEVHDCYIKISDTQYVPYDRYIHIDQKEESE